MLGRRPRVRTSGRADVLVLPKQSGQPGVVIELNVPSRHETAEAAIDEAIAQVRDRGYRARLEERGAEPIHELVAVFDTRRVWVHSVD